MMKMRKLCFLIIITAVLGQRMGAQNLQTAFSEVRCGLNYSQASIILGKRMEAYGYPYHGIDQPAPLIISGIPNSAEITKAFLWWDIAGSDTSENVTLKNPELQSENFPATRIGTNSQCWGIGTAFRADVTNIISGNGTYYLSGLPTDSTFDFYNKSDVTGATLFIIYSDRANSFLGNLILYDGYEKIYNDTVVETISFSPPNDTVSGKAFMILSDMQGEAGNALKLNNGPFTVPQQEYWDFEQKNTVFVPSISYSIYGVRAPNDCVHLLVSGIYFKTEIIPIFPEISRFGDKLTSSAGSAFQWYFNNNLIANSDTQTISAIQSGNYFVEVSDSFGCSFFSDTFQLTVCDEKIKPNINYVAPDSLWTDSVEYSLQWFYNGSAIQGANAPYYIANKDGGYSVRAQDTLGCSVNSDIRLVTGVGNSELWRSKSAIDVYPNPSRGKFNVSLEACPECTLSNLEIYNTLGEKVYAMSKTSAKSIEIDISDQPASIYFLKISDDENGFFFERILQLIND